MDVNVILRKIDELYSAGNTAQVGDLLAAAIRQAEEEIDDMALLSLFNEANGYYRNTGKPEAAVEYAEGAIDLIDRMELRSTVYHAITLINGATACRMAGERGKALSWYHHAEAVLNELPDRRYDYTRASLYNNMSSAYQDSGEPEKALTYLYRAMAIVSKMPGREAEVATSDINIAYALLRLRRFDEAKKSIDEALGYYDSEAGKNDIHYGTALACLAEYEYLTGDRTSAVAYYEKAAEEEKRVLGENNAYKSHMANAEKIRKEL